METPKGQVEVSRVELVPCSGNAAKVVNPVQHCWAVVESHMKEYEMPSCEHKGNLTVSSEIHAM